MLIIKVLTKKASALKKPHKIIPTIIIPENSFMKMTILKVIFTSVGRIVKVGEGSDALWKYEYNLTDHLGNVRAVFAAHDNGIPELMQQTDYYPFGMVMNQQEVLNLEQLQNKYLYNGKELQDDNIGVKLDWYDYGTRFYDPELGRWHTVDPLADEAPGWSPYRYGFNNPTKYIDPSGMLEWEPEIDKEGNVSYIAEQGDNAQTLSEQYGISQEKAEAITGTKGAENIVEGTAISGDKVKSVTGSEALKLDWLSDKGKTDQARINQIRFGLMFSNIKSGLIESNQSLTLPNSEIPQQEMALWQFDPKNFNSNMTGYKFMGRGTMLMNGIQVPVAVDMVTNWTTNMGSVPARVDPTRDYTRENFKYRRPDKTYPQMFITVPAKGNNLDAAYDFLYGKYK